MSSSRWDRPPPPHDWRWVVGGIGRVLIAVGLLMFGFVGYQLWGTGLEYAQAQDRLDDEFVQLLAAAPTTTITTTAPADGTVPGPSTPTSSTTAPADGTVSGPSTPTPSAAPAPTTTAVSPPTPAVPAFEPGDALARIEIPGIGLDAKVVSGVQPEDLKAGPGHYPDTPMPGQLGNSAIAGHRTTYGQPFFRLDEVGSGDEIVLTTVQGRFVYRMISSDVVGPSESHVVATTDPSVARLTLTTCHPRYTAAQRLIVVAELDVDASPPPQPAVIASDASGTESLSPATLPGDPAATAPSTAATLTTVDTVTSTTAVVADSGSGGGTDVGQDTADAFAHGWFSDDAAFAQVALWGLVLSAIGIGSYLLSRRVRHNWVGAVVGVVPFVLALYFFYQNVNRLLPAAI